MKKIGILVSLMLMGSLAYAGFQGINGVTNLGIFNKITCSTGTTCTKSKDSMLIVSSPSIVSTPLTLTAAASTAATFDIEANANATAGDDWQMQSTVSEGGLKFLNNTSGSLVQKMLLSTGGNLSIPGTFTPTGAIIPTGGIGPSLTAPMTIYSGWIPSALADATSTTPVVTDVYLTQIHIANNITVTGIQVLNAAICGTNKWIVALFDDSGTVVANSATAGATCSGASGYQQIPFTGTYAAKGPRTYWLGLYANGTTDRFYAIPLVGQGKGLAGVVTGQTFGTVANVTLPTTFTAAGGAVLTTY